MENHSAAYLSGAPDTLEDTLCLAMVPGVGPRIRRALLARFGSSSSVLAADIAELLAVRGVGSKLAARVRAARGELDAAGELALCRQHGIRVLTEADERYPRMLLEIADPPAVLFELGESTTSDRLSVAIVGTRHATRYGLDQAQRLASGLVRAGLTIVSGLARGIDAAAHRGALAAGGRTIAVLGSGILNLYPPEHLELAREIVRSGALLSELPPRCQPMSGTFPQRNRLITGISLGVIVVEASARSGALISAAHGLEQGREVFAVPGRIDSRTSRGCHRLIRDGAKLVETIDDVLEELGPLAETLLREDGQLVRSPAELRLNEQERTVLAAIDLQPTDIDLVILRSRLPVQRVLATISVLETRQLIHRLSGRLVSRR